MIKRLIFLAQKLCFIMLLIGIMPAHAQEARDLLNQGWAALLKDNDSAALFLFQEAEQKANATNEIDVKATALLYSGFTTYGSSLSNGLHYCLQAMETFKLLEKTSPAKALEGRCRCLQLMSTIKSRQGKLQESIELSREAMQGFRDGEDTTGTLALIFNSLGSAFENMGNRDSAFYYYSRSLEENVRSNHIAYLPNAYCKVAKFSTSENAMSLFQKALAIADSSENKQAQSSTNLAIGNYYIEKKDHTQAEFYINRSIDISKQLQDKSFLLKAIRALASLRKLQGRYEESLQLQEEINTLTDSLSNWEKEHIVKSLEVQFDVLEKNRTIQLIKEENKVARLTNWLLLLSLVFGGLIASLVVWFLRKVNKRNEALLIAQEELAKANAEQKRLREVQLQNEIEYKESQLTALTLQMLQKNELMQELKEKYDQETSKMKDSGVGKIINKAMNQEKDWEDFNTHFESINKNFYQRLKQNFPDISPNEMKICALIKLNLSIKEMAGILNISPDSVKTARYRLRKKLDLNTEDNLTDFIMKL